MADDEKSAALKVAWAPDHKIIFANSFGMRIGDSDVMVDLGTVQSIGDGPVILSSHQLAMTPRAAKLLGAMLSEAIKALETKIGEIPLGPQLDPILKSLEDQVAKLGKK